MTVFLGAFQNHPVKFVKQLAGVEQEYEAQKATIPYIIEATSPSWLSSQTKTLFSTGCSACPYPHVTCRRHLWIYTCPQCVGLSNTDKGPCSIDQTPEIGYLHQCFTQAFPWAAIDSAVAVTAIL